MHLGWTSEKLRGRLPLLAIGLGAALVRIAAAWHPLRIVWGDEPFYLWLGRNWMTGQGYSFTGYADIHHTPFYPLLSGLLYLVTRNLELASNLCYVLFGVLLVVPLYAIAKELYGRGAGLAAAALVAVYPSIAVAPAFWGTLTEPPYYFFVYSGLWMTLLAIRRGERRFHFLAGVAFGAAYLTRPEAVAYLAVAVGVLALVRLSERRALERSSWMGLALLASGFLLFLLPYAYYVFRETGSWMVSEKAGVTFITCLGLSEGDTRAFDEATWGLDTTGCEVFFFSRESYHVSMIDAIRAYPSEFVALLSRNARWFLGALLSTRLFSHYLLPLLGVAFFRRAWTKDRAKGELLLAASLLPVGVFLLFFIQDRYIATLLPTLVVWLGYATWESGEWLLETLGNLLQGRVGSNRMRVAIRALPTLLLVVFLIALQPRVVAGYTDTGSYRLEHKTLGLWLKDRLPRDAVVMSRYPAIAFYADVKWEPTPNAEFEALMRYARFQKVDYFVLDEGETNSLRPQLAYLFDPDQIPPELELVHVDQSTGDRLAIFRLQ